MRGWLHRHPHVFPMLGVEALLFWCVAADGPILLTAFLVVVVAHGMHAQLIAFHEATHYHMAPNRRFNEIGGTFIGLAAFMSLSLYRAIHKAHHAALSTQKDEELWPFNDPAQPRWKRRLAAFGELFLGLVYTPLLFFRAFIRPGTVIRDSQLRKRIWFEFALMGVMWGTVGAFVTLLEAWPVFLLGHFLPAWLAGNFQSWRKYVEHMGLTSGRVAGLTRSVHSPDPVGRVLAFSLLHEPYHGVHHEHGTLPHSVLPNYAEELPDFDEHGERLLFPTYRAAVWDMIRSLRDPRVGSQWQNESAEADQPAEAPAIA